MYELRKELPDDLEQSPGESRFGALERYIKRKRAERSAEERRQRVERVSGELEGMSSTASTKVRQSYFPVG
jgi:hypothetical protein